MKRKKLLIGGIFLFLCICVTPVYAITDVKYQNAKTPSMENVNGITDKELVKRATINNKELIITANTEEVVLYEGTEYPKEYNNEGYSYGNDGTHKYLYFAPNYSVNYSNDGISYQKKTLNSVIKNLLNITIDDNHRPEVDSLYAVNGEFYIFFTIETITRTKNEYPVETYANYLLKTSDGINYKKVEIPNYKPKETRILEYDGTYIMTTEMSVKDINETIKTYTYYTSKDLVNWTKKEIDTSIFGLEKNHYAWIERINGDGVIFASEDYSIKKTIYLNTTDFENYQIYEKKDDLEDILERFRVKGYIPAYDYYKSEEPNNRYLFLLLNNSKDSTVKLVHFKDYQKREYTEYNLNIQFGTCDYAFKDNKFIFIYTINLERSVMCFDLETQVLKKIKLPSKSETNNPKIQEYYFTNDRQHIVFASVNGFKKMKLYDMYNAEIIKNMLGDINGDEKIGLTDVLMSLKMYFNSSDNMSEDQKLAADLNEDNKVDLTDILMLLKAYFNSSN